VIRGEGKKAKGGAALGEITSSFSRNSGKETFGVFSSPVGGFNDRWISNWEALGIETCRSPLSEENRGKSMTHGLLPNLNGYLPGTKALQ